MNRTLTFLCVIAAALVAAVPAGADTFAPYKSKARPGPAYTVAEALEYFKGHGTGTRAELAARQLVAFRPDYANRALADLIGESRLVYGRDLVGDLSFQNSYVDDRQQVAVATSGGQLAPDQPVLVDQSGRPFMKADCLNPIKTEARLRQYPTGEIPLVAGPPGPLGPPGPPGEVMAGDDECFGLTPRECARHRERMAKIEGDQQVQLARAYNPPNQEAKWSGAVFPFGFYQPTRTEANTFAPTLTNAPTRVDSHDRTRVDSNDRTRIITHSPSDIRNFPPPVVVPPVITPPSCTSGLCPPLQCPPGVQCPPRFVPQPRFPVNPPPGHFGPQPGAPVNPLVTHQATISPRTNRRVIGNRDRQVIASNTNERPQRRVIGR